MSFSSCILRYLFTWFPGFPHAHALMALFNVQHINVMF